MSQQRITLFFPCISRKKTSPNTRCLFLELPVSVRHKIYYEAGLVSGETIHLNYWRSRRKENISRTGHSPRVACLPSLPLNLFAVCHSIHNELRKVLYRENRLVVSWKAPRGVRLLDRLSHATLREIRFLIVRLNIASCESRCCGVRSYRCGNIRHYSSCLSSSHDTPLSADTDQLVLPQWQRICTQLARSIQPDNLSLYVICDCADAVTAQIVAKSLLLLPVLRDCGLRLAMHTADDIKTTAKDSATYLTGSTPPLFLLPFRFFDLPKEIQIHILEYTDLVNRSEISCTQKQLRYWTSCRSQGAIADTTSIINTALLKCFCRAAHSAFSSQCSCDDLTSPFAMFLVSREFREGAMQVFYGQNSFCVAMQNLVSSPQGSTSLSFRDVKMEITEPRSEISIGHGLASFPPSSIAHLTSLILLFQFSNVECLQPDRAEFGHWLTAVGILSQEANLEAMTLQLRMSENFYPDFDDEKPTSSPIYESFMRQTYENLVRPMKILRGRLKNLFLHLNWSTSSGFPDGRREHEQMLEKMVMGQTYDAWKCGKTIRYPGRYEDARERQRLVEMGLV